MDTQDPLERYLNRCVHFNGVQHGSCKEGVKYREVGNGKTYACYDPENKLCPKQQFPTREEAQKQKDEMDAAVQKVLDDLKAGNCPVCGKKPEKKVQVGRCVYAEPCGHRMYQGRA